MIAAKVNNVLATMTARAITAQEESARTVVKEGVLTSSGFSLELCSPLSVASYAALSSSESAASSVNKFRIWGSTLGSGEEEALFKSYMSDRTTITGTWEALVGKGS